MCSLLGIQELKHVLAKPEAALAYAVTLQCTHKVKKNVVRAALLSEPAKEH